MTNYEVEKIRSLIKLCNERAEHYKKGREKIQRKIPNIMVPRAVNDIIDIHQRYSEMAAISYALEKILEKFGNSDDDSN